MLLRAQPRGALRPRNAVIDAVLQRLTVSAKQAAEAYTLAETAPRVAAGHRESGARPRSAAQFTMTSRVGEGAGSSSIISNDPSGNTSNTPGSIT